MWRGTALVLVALAVAQPTAVSQPSSAPRNADTEHVEYTHGPFPFLDSELVARADRTAFYDASVLADMNADLFAGVYVDTQARVVLVGLPGSTVRAAPLLRRHPAVRFVSTATLSIEPAAGVGSELRALSRSLRDNITMWAVDAETDSLDVEAMRDFSPSDRAAAEAYASSHGLRVRVFIDSDAKFAVAD